MRITRWFAVIAVATVCVMLFLQGGIADAASSTTQHATRPAGPTQHRAPAFGTTSTLPWQIVDLRFPSGVPTSTL